HVRNHEVGTVAQGSGHLPFAPGGIGGRPGGNMGVSRLDIAPREAFVIMLDERRTGRPISRSGPRLIFGCGAVDTVARHSRIIAGSPGAVNARSARRIFAAAEASSGSTAMRGTAIPRIVSVQGVGRR